MSDLAGRLNIALHRDGGRLGVTIASTRPLVAPGVFVGRGVRETARRLPGLFSVCATAQASACAQALEQALGLTPDPSTSALRQALVDAETVKEHLWRLLLEWPRLLGEAPAAAAMREVLQAWGGLRPGVGEAAGAFVPGGLATRPDRWAPSLARLARVAAAEVFGAPAEAWLARMATPEDFLAWAEDAGTRAARLVLGVLRGGEAGLGSCVVEALLDLDPLVLADRLSGPGASAFVARPDWGGLPRETSPFTRVRHLEPVAGLVLTHGNGLLARQAAVLVEVATLLTRLRGALDDGFGAPRCATGTGTGLSQVQAARGVLVHRVELDRADLDRGLVRDYRILAPTEWNFHPQGVVARGLATLSPTADEGRLRHQAELYVTLVDPCVDYVLSVV
jgi:uptake hydrogenase large subunit